MSEDSKILGPDGAPANREPEKSVLNDREHPPFSELWEPKPGEMLSDYDLACLIVRDGMAYINAKMPVDVPEEIEGYVALRLERYGSRMTEFQVSYYRAKMNEGMVKALMEFLMQQQMQAQATYNEVQNGLQSERGGRTQPWHKKGNKRR